MWRWFLLAFLFPIASWAQDGTDMSWLDNRFRVDPTIRQASFVVYREKASQPVVLVRPDGVKYYAWKHPKNVAWHEEDGMDIISVEKPMPGPWQAIGKVTPKNRIKVLSNLTMNVDNLPAKLYQSEVLKFTARLLQNDKPLVLRDFLDRVNLNVVFTEYVANEDDLPKEAKPLSTIVGTYSDDGQGMDEFPGDGVFTVDLPITVKPGKYRVRIRSGNGVFLRTIEQEVLVYPPPIRASFIQARTDKTDHAMSIDTEAGVVLPGSLSAHIEQQDPEGINTVSQGQSHEEEIKLYFNLPNSNIPGRNSWWGWVYATDKGTSRELIFPLPKQNYGVVEPIDLESTYAAYQAEKEAKRLAEEALRLEEERKAAQTKALIAIGVGNLIVILLGVLGVFIWRKVKQRKAKAAEQLSMPPPPKV